jgi:hypothetical protein
MVRQAHGEVGDRVAEVVEPAVQRLGLGAVAAPELRFVSTIHLEHYPTPPREIAIEPYARIYPFSYSSDEIPDLGRTVERHYPDPDHAVDGWARRFVASEGPTETLALLTAMTHAIREELTYAARDAEGTQPPVETLASRGGSCRDFALLLMAPPVRLLRPETAASLAARRRAHRGPGGARDRCASPHAAVRGSRRSRAWYDRTAMKPWDWFGVVTRRSTGRAGGESARGSGGSRCCS